MYKLPYFTEKDQSKVLRFMKEDPFVTLCGVDAEYRPVVTQVPVLFREENDQLFLRGHIMKNTDHHKAFMQNENVMVVFTSPSCYVSASWYSDPQQGSTWNYMTVQAKGTVSFLNEEELVQMLSDTTTHFEKNNDSPASFKFIPQEYVDRMTKAIVAFEIKVHSIENVFKLSQNRDEQSFDNIIDHLENGGYNERYIAGEMKKIRHELFQEVNA